MLTSGARVRLLLMTITVALLGAALTACGGGGGGLTPGLETADSWPGHGWEGAATAGDFALVAVDDSERQLDPLTEQLELALSGDGGRQVSISAELAEATDHAWLHLRYDAGAMHPVATSLAPELAGRALFLGITEKPGVVSLGIAAIGGRRLLAGDRALCAVEFEPGPYTGTRKVSAVSDSVVTDLHFNSSDRSLLEWTYRCKGDYNQDSLVTVADLTPIGVYFEHNFESPDWQAAQVADGDGNLYVIVSDLTPIGQNFDEAVTGYKVQGGASQSGPFAGEAIVPHSKDLEPAGGGFLHFTYDVPAPVEGAWYVVWAMQNTQVAAEHSNAAQYSEELILAPPAQLVAVHQDDHILLSWDAPSGTMPDGYEAYISATADLVSPGDGIKLHTGVISGTTFEVDPMFSPDAPHYFGVLGVYGSERSPLSNIFHYQPGGNDAPANLMAALSGDHIQLSWDAPAAGTPDGYNAYIASNGEMTGALPVNAAPIAGTTFDADPVFSPDTEHYFGVKAIYGVAESEYSNIYHYDPAAEHDPPTWNPGEVGIKAATPGEERVTVEWWTATDAESGPVTYLIHWDEEVSFDWATANVVTALATDVDKSVTGLTNGVAYEFGVRARDTLGNTDTNTNTLVRTPLGGGVPFDDGVWQGSELVDDGGALSSQQVGWFTNVEAKDDGTIGISHHNESSGDLLYSEISTGSPTWTTVTVASQGQTGQWNDLEFHPVTGHPCIAYHNEDDASLEYSEFNGSTWDTTTVDSGGDKGAFASLEFDPSDNNPAIAYFDAVNQDVRFAKYDGTEWDTEIAYNGTAGGTNLSGAFCDLAYNPTNNRAGIAFARTYDFGGLPQMACWITEHNGTSWSAQAACYGPYNDLSIDTAGWANNLCYGPTGIAYIITVELMGEVLIADNSAGGWDPTTHVSVGTTGPLTGGQVDRVYTDIQWYSSDFYWVYYDKQGLALDFGIGYGSGPSVESGGNGGFPSLDIDGLGNLHTAYVDSTGGQLRYALSINNGDSWTPQTADSGEGGMGTVGERASLAYHPTSYYPMISYYDASNTALKYADKQPDSWRDEIVSDTANDGGASGMGVDSAGAAYISFFSVSTEKAALKMADGGFGSWDFTTIVEADLIVGGDVSGNYCAMAVNYPPVEAPGVAYHNTTQRRLEFAQGDSGGGYETTTVSEFNDPGRWNAVAYNPANKFVGVATYVRDTQDLYFVQRAGSGVWAPVPVDASGMVGNRCSLVYGETTARPWISYYDESNNRLKVAYVPTVDDWDTDPWEYVTIPAPDSSADYGGFSSIAWHPEHNRPAVAFYDTDAGKLWYVFIGDPAAPQAAVEVAGGVNLEGAYCSLRFNPDTNQPGVAYQDVTNGDLRYVERHAE